MKCVPTRIHEAEVVRIDVLAGHFHCKRADVIRAVVRLGIPALFELYKADPQAADRLIAEGERFKRAAGLSLDLGQ